MAKPVKAKDQIRLGTGEVMTLGAALDRGLVTLGTTEEPSLRPRGERLTVRTYYAKDPVAEELWPVSRALFESRSTGTFKPGSPAPPKISVPETPRAPVVTAATTPFMVVSNGDHVGDYADLPSAIVAADRWQEEYDRHVNIFKGPRVLSKREIDAARAPASTHATKSPALLDREIAALVPSWRVVKR